MVRSAMVAAGLAACVIGVAACGGGNSGSSSNSGGGAYSQAGAAKSTPAPVAGSAAVTVKLSKTKLGDVLTDGKGRTLYLFEKDKGTKSSCFGPCATGWPPLTATGEPALAGGLAASMLGTTARSGGAHQVTYGGHPLYYFVGDKAAGQTAGEGVKAFGAEWYALSASGKKVDEDDGGS